MSNETENAAPVASSAVLGDRPTAMQMSNFRKQLEEIINCNCMENGSDTPDFILAEYMHDCLLAWDRATKRREEWYGRKTQAVSSPNDKLRHGREPDNRKETK